MSKRKRAHHGPRPGTSPLEIEGQLWKQSQPAPTAPEAPAESAISAEFAAAAPDAAAPAPAEAPPTTEHSAELERLAAQSAEYLDGWQRARAEFANYKKRIEREQEETRGRAAAEILAHYVIVLDDLERALKERPTDGEAGAWAQGIDLIYRKLMAILEAEGVETFKPDGQSFDPTLHEAISHELSQSHREGQIIEVIHPGYKLGDRVLRPALVRVAK